ncbi:WXG100 family type VII secretion target [Nocardia ignorata]|uniref:WXG100 family type VII secretion target n=1 Tax=Actinomycetes TaxID=1760 RepID=UPI003637C396
MNNSVSVIPDEVQEIGRIAYRVATELRSGADSLDTSVVQLLASWTGTAAESYQRAWGDMQTGSRRVWDELFELAEKLGVTAENFQATDTGSAESIFSLDL